MFQRGTTVQYIAPHEDCGAHGTVTGDLGDGETYTVDLLPPRTGSALVGAAPIAVLDPAPVWPGPALRNCRSGGLAIAVDSRWRSAIRALLRHDAQLCIQVSVEVVNYASFLAVKSDNAIAIPADCALLDGCYHFIIGQKA
jgi:hypothetical protein